LIVGGENTGRPRRLRLLARAGDEKSVRGHQHGAEHRARGANRLAPVHRSRHRFCLASSRAAWSTARAVSVIYRIDGLWLPVDVMHAPSVTNTFLHACSWFHSLS